MLIIDIKRTPALLQNFNRVSALNCTILSVRKVGEKLA